MLLPTTEALPDQTPVDSVSAEQAAALMLDGHMAALSVITPALPQITKASQLMTHAIKGSGTLHYAAAGSSGLLALADCCELAGTFGIWEKQVRIHMAGGIPVSAAMSGDVEDDIESARAVVGAATPKDVFITLSASGTTPFALAIATAVKAAGSKVIGMANNVETPLLDLADVPICLATGPEIIAGSTRLGAGTAQKAALNIMSSLMGVQLGHVYKGRMVNLIVDNEKLVNRATQVVAEISGVSQSIAVEALTMAEGRVKLAILLASGADLGAANDLLTKHAGHLGPSLSTIKSSTTTIDH
jgi:N-acetylmuramic acid 6-phosphate etherase